MPRESQEWMTAAEVARKYGISAETVRRYARLGMLPVNYLPSGHMRIRPEDAERVLSKKRRPGS